MGDQLRILLRRDCDEDASREPLESHQDAIGAPSACQHTCEEGKPSGQVMARPKSSMPQSEISSTHESHVQNVSVSRLPRHLMKGGNHGTIGASSTHHRGVINASSKHHT